MENTKFKNISELLGKGVEVSESPKSTKKQEEKYFLELIETLCQIEASSALISAAGIHLNQYEEMHIKAISMLSEKYFGRLKTSIIMWWVFESISPDGDIYPLLTEDGVKHIINTPLQLFKFLKQYDGK
jgi:MoaA/NifB/PqqE/SkfB family radical SAM enzyme